MENLNIEGTPTTPEVRFHAEKGELFITGSSTIEYPFDFYEKLMDWVDAYAKEPQPKTTVLISLEYFNTSSSKCLLNFLKKVAELKDNGDLTIKWEYEEDDEDAYDIGNDFSRLVKIPFELIPIS